MALQDLRQNYTPPPLAAADLSPDPFTQFEAWFEDAQAANILEPNAFTLATVNADGHPAARTVLLKGIDEPDEATSGDVAGGDSGSDSGGDSGGGSGGHSGGDSGGHSGGVARGFVFYTNYASAKGRDLAGNPHAAMNFYWDTLARCIRIVGSVSKVSAEETAAYFHSRPRPSQLGAWASHQSSVIADRGVLIQRLGELEAQHPEGDPIAVPPTWGGYRVAPESFEFWQGQPSRLHDRLRYSPTENGWTIERLSP